MVIIFPPNRVCLNLSEPPGRRRCGPSIAACTYVRESEAPDCVCDLSKQRTSPPGPSLLVCDLSILKCKPHLSFHLHGVGVISAPRSQCLCALNRCDNCWLTRCRRGPSIALGEIDIGRPASCTHTLGGCSVIYANDVGRSGTVPEKIETIVFCC